MRFSIKYIYIDNNININMSYHQSFKYDDHDNILEYFVKNKYVVIEEIIDKNECKKVYEAIGKLIGGDKNFNIYDYSTYDNVEPTNKHGMYTKDPIFIQEIMDLRQNEKLYTCVKNILNNEFIVSHDRYIFQKPTTNIIIDNKILDKEEYKTYYKYPNVHLDMSPKGYVDDKKMGIESREKIKYNDPHDFIPESSIYHYTEGLRLQCILNILDNKEEDGGFICVPNFDFENWYKDKKENEWDYIKNAERYAFDGMSNVDMKYVHSPIRIPMKAGSIVIWNRTVAHGAKPNSSNKPRLGIPLAFTPKNQFDKNFLKRRRVLLNSIIEQNNIIVSDIGKKVFDL